MISDPCPPGERSFVSFPIPNFQWIKRQMLTWASQVGICCFLDNHGYRAEAAIPATFECLLAVGAVDTLECPAGDAFSTLKTWSAARREWLFGHFSYDLARETEPGPPAVPDASTILPDGLPAPPAGAIPPAGSSADNIGFPDLFFFIPEILIELHSGHIRIGSFHNDQEAIWRQILDTAAPEHSPTPIPLFIPRFTREEYLDTVRRLQRHILRGDCYEINFCQEFFSYPACPDPLSTWWSLSQASPNPFAAFYRLGERYLLCASPERYLKKTGDTLISQPIKGTSPRYPGDPPADEASGRLLFHSRKDRSENVMVVDLVRNDLSKVCLPGSVSVDELYGIYPFPQVFQMISTITGRPAPDKHWTDMIRATFPMGSMTGAPKHKVVELIGQYERSRRGIFSGAVGYVAPNGDFDFNVVIRSLLLNRDHQYLSYLVGSGITFYSDPQAEYEECLIKAEGIRRALGQ
jgi:para-aminobenzoate synthetase component 1